MISDLRAKMRKAGCSYELMQKVQRLIKDEDIDWNEYNSITQGLQRIMDICKG